MDGKQTMAEAATPIFAHVGEASATTGFIAQAAERSEAPLTERLSTEDALSSQLERHCVEANAVDPRLFDGAAPWLSSPQFAAGRHRPALRCRQAPTHLRSNR